MPRGQSAVYAATALFFAGLAIAIVGFLQIERNAALGFGLLAAGFAVVVGASLYSRRGSDAEGGDRPSKGA